MTREPEKISAEDLAGMRLIVSKPFARDKIAGLPVKVSVMQSIIALIDAQAAELAALKAERDGLWDTVALIAPNLLPDRDSPPPDDYENKQP